MSLFQKESHDKWRQKRSQEQLARGGLPLKAEYRLRGLENNPRLYTSTLSVNEFVFSKSDGLKPCGSVTGTSVFYTGMQANPVYNSGEQHASSYAQIHGRKLAVGRMLLEAKHLNAHEVVGVRLIENTHDWDRQGMEFTAVGTAVQRAGRRPTDMPLPKITSNLPLASK